MSDITEYERRIAAALERIGHGVEALAQPVAVAPEPAPAGDAGEVIALREALESERAANAQLVERVRAIKEKQDSTIGALERRVAKLTAQLETGGLDAAKLRRANTQLSDASQALREAMAAALPEPHLINKAMLAELEALRALRASDAAEMEEILAELKPFLTPQPAPDQTEASHA
ncbi:hypothetical protein GVY41_16840 [Frigidibacter albus]|uniref:Colicin transporter n=1 Tax=Frigidibacter albus TaxID=1465486 RepID=A0A6L8VKT4_9RHOB|nr:hypothetical protein [Frigidibacter albus]MZQ90674.1 hypothetical protein [Frigidibacter albus]NBE32670.1 hypothetical protein [Frigidibacter albus]GGH60307.1 hypothetical protein GCM10011341_32440 [Frigidibacter albus]